MRKARREGKMALAVSRWIVRITAIALLVCASRAWASEEYDISMHGNTGANGGSFGGASIGPPSLAPVMQISGQWSGIYHGCPTCERGVRIPFNVDFRGGPGTFKGVSTEPNRFGDHASPYFYARWHGQVARNGVVRVHKTYYGDGGPSHSADYHGQFKTNDLIEGVWSIDGSKGAFRIWRGRGAAPEKSVSRDGRVYVARQRLNDRFIAVMNVKLPDPDIVLTGTEQARIKSAIRRAKLKSGHRLVIFGFWDSGARNKKKLREKIYQRAHEVKIAVDDTGVNRSEINVMLQETTNKQHKNRIYVVQEQ
jgi:hypothetical protein